MHLDRIHDLVPIKGQDHTRAIPTAFPALLQTGLSSQRLLGIVAKAFL